MMGFKTMMELPLTKLVTMIMVVLAYVYGTVSLIRVIPLTCKWYEAIGVTIVLICSVKGVLRWIDNIIEWK